MVEPVHSQRSVIAEENKGKRLFARIVKHRYIYLLIMPGLLFLILFKIVPIWGLSLAVVDYNPMVGLFKSNWVGFTYFTELFSDKTFYLMLRNTIVINLLSIIFFFPLPIVVAIMINEVKKNQVKKLVQSMVYLPHFMSWVVITSLTFFALSPDVGIINKILMDTGHETIDFVSNKNLFWIIVTLQNMWKDTGWGTILFLAALSGIDPQIYESAGIDGASRMKQIFHITLPSLIPTIVVLLILRLGHIADVSLEQMLLMQNSLNIDVSEVFDTYSFTQGIMQGQLSIGVTVGIFKSFVGLAFVVGANKIIKSLGYEGIY